MTSYLLVLLMLMLMQILLLMFRLPLLLLLLLNLCCWQLMILLYLWSFWLFVSSLLLLLFLFRPPQDRTRCSRSGMKNLEQSLKNLLKFSLKSFFNRCLCNHTIFIDFSVLSNRLLQCFVGILKSNFVTQMWNTVDQIHAQTKEPHCNPFRLNYC